MITPKSVSPVLPYLAVGIALFFGGLSALLHETQPLGHQLLVAAVMGSFACTLLAILFAEGLEGDMRVNSRRIGAAFSLSAVTCAGVAVLIAYLPETGVALVLSGLLAFGGAWAVSARKSVATKVSPAVREQHAH